MMVAQLVRFSNVDPVDRVLCDDHYWLDLSVTPRPRHVRACYPGRWSPHRFERIGKVFLVPPGCELHVRSDGGAQQLSIICRFRPEMVDAVFADSFVWSDRVLEASLNIQSASIRGLLQRLAQEAGYPGAGSERLVELIAAQLVIELSRYFHQISEIPLSGGLAPWRLRLITERLRQVREPPTLEELATLCKLSVRQLTRAFRASRGCSIGDYVASKRINHAKHLLATGASVKDIARDLGFSSSSSFCYAFRRATGVTPREFRQRALRLIE